MRVCSMWSTSSTGSCYASDGEARTATGMARATDRAVRRDTRPRGGGRADGPGHREPPPTVRRNPGAAAVTQGSPCDGPPRRADGRVDRPPHRSRTTRRSDRGRARRRCAARQTRLASASPARSGVALGGPPRAGRRDTTSGGPPRDASPGARCRSGRRSRGSTAVRGRCGARRHPRWRVRRTWGCGSRRPVAGSRG